MATTYDDIYDLFSIHIRDYELDDLYQSSSTDWAEYLEGFLVLSIPKFNTCESDLSDRNDTTNTFNITLTEMEQTILSALMVDEWQSKNVKDIRQMNLSLNDTDFKHYAEANNLKNKEAALDMFRIRTYQLIVDYGMDETLWEDWASGDYSGRL